MPPEGRGREWKVGLVILLAVVLFAVGILLIGQESNLFRRKNHYLIYFSAVGGLNEGNPVQLDGVNVGRVRSIVLPTEARSSQIEVEIEVDRRYEARIRQDSMARIKTLGLLGDKFVDLTAGSPEAEPIAPGGVIPAAPPTSVDKLIGSGEDVMDNVVQISADLRDILHRMEQGQGVLGELTSKSETGQRVTDSLLQTMDSIQRVADQVENGDGPLPRLIHDKQLAERMSGSVDRLNAILDEVQNGDGLLPGLLHDPKTREQFDATLGSLRDVSENLQGFSKELQQGKGLLPRLVHDQELGDETSRELKDVLERIDNVAKKLDEGDGTAGKLINDPSIYQAINDIVVGVNESRVLRWLIRNRQKKGIEKRYQEANPPGGSGHADDGGADRPQGPEPRKRREER